MAALDLGELLAHRPPMLLLDRVCSHDGARIVAAVDLGRGRPFVDGQGRLPAWVTLEYMAQAAGAHAGIDARASGAGRLDGLLLGTRRLRLLRDVIDTPATLEVEAECLVRTRDGLAAYRCCVREGPDLIADADVKVIGRAGLYAAFSRAFAR